MKILIAGFQHETNTFAPTKANWEDFVHGGGMPSMTHGSDVMELRGINIPMGGFLEAMHGTIHDLVPVDEPKTLASPFEIPINPRKIKAEISISK